MSEGRRSSSPLPLVRLRRLALALLALCATSLPAVAAAPPPLAADAARVHYHRPKGDYPGWGLHAWEDTRLAVEWGRPLPPSGTDGFGLYWDVPLKPDAKRLGFIVHAGDRKDPGPDQFVDLAKGREWWVVSGKNEIHATRPDVSSLAFGDLSRARAYWLDRRTLAWNVPAGEVRLCVSPTATLRLAKDGVSGGTTFALEREPAGLTPVQRTRFPWLGSYAVFRLGEADAARAEELVRGQVALTWQGPDGSRDATGVQLAGVLDDLFATDAPLGLTWANGAPTLSVWAPTAQKVRLLLFDGPRAAAPASTIDMTRAGGVWSAAGTPAWKGRYYLYEVTVFHPLTGRVETVTATDPYSRGLARDGARSLIVDLDDPATKPPGWDATAKPPLAAPEDAVLYELHVRDFSASDASVPAAHRGTFLAFTDTATAGSRRLRSLAAAGVSHVHLLPAFDIATVREDRSVWQSPGDLSGFPPDGEQQQAALARVRGNDGFNWGYDPHHFGVPEGSYATDPDGVARIVEFRRMVQALAGMGLRTVMDVVYNHTHAAGLSPHSVLDRVVPGYYQRLNADGVVENSTCCANTASENRMMERFILDDVAHWARDYKVDGFRFDLMGHHMKRNMEALRARLDGLTPASAGIDGKAVLVYGEGWDFGEVQGGKRGVNATQRALAGTGIATFNDRLRDGVRGGSAFSDRREQGFATGRWTHPSGFNGATESDRAKLAEAADRIRVGLAGNLAGYRFTDRNGYETSGAAVGGAGYTADPQECINYVSAHDNETLWDKILLAAPAQATVEQRARMSTLALAFPALAQGIPFFHAGCELLRTKSMDADSYDSGDWYNRVDWTLTTNHHGMGLPGAEKNRDRWNLMRPLLARADLSPSPEVIRAAAARFEALLRVRRSSPLFRLRDAEEVQARVRFPGLTGADPGVIVMALSDVAEGRADLDPRWERILVVFNAHPGERVVVDQSVNRFGWTLHPVLAGGADPVVKQARVDRDRSAFVVPGLSVAVFVSE